MIELVLLVTGAYWIFTIYDFVKIRDNNIE